MEHKTLYMVRGDSGEEECLSTDYKFVGTWRNASDKDITLDSMARMLDQDAENENRHSMVGCHQSLVDIMQSAEVPEAKAIEVMRYLCDAGGFHNLR